MGPAARKYVPREPHCQPHRTPYSSAAKLSGLGEGTGFSGASPSRRTDFRVTRVQSLNPPRNSWSLGFSLGLKVRILLRLRPRESTRSAGSAAESPQSGRHLLHYNSYLLRNDHGQGRKRQKPSWGRKAAATGADIAGRGLSHTFSHEPRVGGGGRPTRGHCPRRPLPTIARAGSLLFDVTTPTGTGLAVTAEHVSLGTLADEGSVRVDAGVLATVVAQQAVIHSCKIPQPGNQITDLRAPLTLLLLPWEGARSPGDSPTISPGAMSRGQRGARRPLRPSRSPRWWQSSSL